MRDPPPRFSQSVPQSRGSPSPPRTDRLPRFLPSHRYSRVRSFILPPFGFFEPKYSHSVIRGPPLYPFGVSFVWSQHPVWTPVFFHLEYGRYPSQRKKTDISPSPHEEFSFTKTNFFPPPNLILTGTLNLPSYSRVKTWFSEEVPPSTVRSPRSQLFSHDVYRTVVTLTIAGNL